MKDWPATGAYNRHILEKPALSFRQQIWEAPQGYYSGRLLDRWLRLGMLGIVDPDPSWNPLCLGLVMRPPLAVDVY